MHAHAHDPILAGQDLATFRAPLALVPVTAPSAVYRYLDAARRLGRPLTEAAAVIRVGLGTATITGRNLADLLLERDHLLRRLDEVCPEHVACGACGTALCEACGVGEPSTCGHHSPTSYCVGCDIEACGDCAREARPFTVGGA